MKPPRSKTVLVIEDDPGLQSTLILVLEEAGYSVRACASAQDGLALATAFHPTLIICDVHLAEGDGRKLLESIRQDATLADCQFVMMTGDWVGASQQTSVKLEADSYLAKPFTVEEFNRCVEEQFRQANL